MMTPALDTLSKTITNGKDPITNAKPAKKELDQNDFLRLLMTQLQFQDPLKPIENQEFTAQLTSFNSLNQLVDLNKKIEAMQQEQLSLTQLQATSLIGKEVSLLGNRIHLDGGGKAAIPFQLAGDAGRVSIHIVAKDGTAVRTIEAGGGDAGEQKIAWDGKTDSGDDAAEGDYTFEVDAFDTQGKKVEVKTLVSGVVTGVDLSGAELSVTINGIQVPYSALTAVRTPSSAA